MELRLLKNVDLPLLIASLAVAALGCVMVSSASWQDPRFAHLAMRQASWIGLGLAVVVAFTWLDYQLLVRMSRWLYVANLGMLGLVLLVGRSIGGSQRWVSVGPVHIQPSEFAKILVVVTLAGLLHSSREGRSRLSVILQSVTHLSLPLLLILLQPDLGTALVFLAAWLAMLWTWGITRRQLCAIVLTGALLGTAAWKLDLIRDYQKERFSAFIAPEKDPGGAGYQIIQSQIAIGAGGLWGTGLYRGTQNRLAFIPTQTTDFIFTIAGEELGFVGSVGLVALYFFLLWRAILIAMETEDALGTLIATGIVSILAFQIFINLGMSMRLTPVTGLPLPFVSYGGSSMLTSFMGVGLLQSISLRRRSIQF